MFTGIIEQMGKVVESAEKPFGRRLVIDQGDWDCKAHAGDSIAVNGCCLTHAPDDSTGGRLAFDVVKETLDLTTLGDLVVGAAVNLEGSLTASTPMSGHFVQGHIDAVGEIAHIDSGEEDRRIAVKVDQKLMPFVIPKGSIAIDGISLTVASVDVDASEFTVALIPTTLKLTTLGNAKPGDRVNLETDMIVRTVVHCLNMQKSTGKVTVETLRRAGFAE